ncbi:hypothetical protein Chor_014886, partial [Crotalus horridus]
MQSKMASETAPKTTEVEAEEEAPPGEDLPLKGESKQEIADGKQLLGTLDPEKVLEQSISIRQQIFLQNEAEVSKRWNFEDGIKRPYFHVKPLERAQLRNWRDYLDFEIASGSHERTITFEDCVPGLVMVRLRRVSLERRLGNTDMAEALLMEAIRDNEGMPISSFYSVKLARQILKDNAKLYANLLEMEFSADVRQNEGNTMSSFDRALTSGLPLETKIIFSQRRVEFLEDFGSSINSLLMCYEEHQKLLNQQMMRKRLLENGSVDETDDKRLRLEDAAIGGGSVAMATTGITPLMASDTSAAGTYNYNTWYQ